MVPIASTIPSLASIYYLYTSIYYRQLSESIILTREFLYVIFGSSLYTHLEHHDRYLLRHNGHDLVDKPSDCTGDSSSADGDVLSR